MLRGLLIVKVIWTFLMYKTLLVEGSSVPTNLLGEKSTAPLFRKRGENLALPNRGD